MHTGELGENLIFTVILAKSTSRKNYCVLEVKLAVELLSSTSVASPKHLAAPNGQGSVLLANQFCKGIYNVSRDM